MSNQGVNFYQYQNGVDQETVKVIKQNILMNLQLLSKIKYQLRNNQFATLVGDHQRDLTILDEITDPLSCNQQIVAEQRQKQTKECQKQEWEKQFDCNVINQPVYLLPPTSRYSVNNSTPWSQ